MPARDATRRAFNNPCATLQSPLFLQTWTDWLLYQIRPLNDYGEQNLLMICDERET